jgi:hypothetical protein
MRLQDAAALHAKAALRMGALVIRFKTKDGGCFVGGQAELA